MKKDRKKGLLDDLAVDVFLNNPNVAEFIGPNFGYYKELWLKDYKKKKTARKMQTCIHWNTLAFFMWPAWFGYRKMIVWLVAFSLLMAAFSFAEEYWSFGTGSNSAVGAMVLVIALKSKSFYFSHVVEKINAIEAMPDSEMRAMMIEKRGGTSITYAVLGILFFVLSQILAIYLGTALKSGV